MEISFAAATAPDEEDALPGFREFGFRLCDDVVHDGADGDLEYEIFAVVAIAELVAPVASALCGELLLISELAEERDIGHAFHIYTAALAAASANGPEAHLVLIERDSTLTARSGGYLDSNVIN
jgi:hypothetical protein